MRNLIKKTKKTGANKPLFVLLSDGFGLLATVVGEVDGVITIIESARSNEIDPITSLLDVVGKLTVSYGKLPGDAILLYAHAIPSILELGIENVEMLNEEKLQELIRWEMESVFADLVPRDSIGWLLTSLNYLLEEQRDELVNKIISENESSKKKIRFGELALSEGFISRGQLEECLKVQDQLQLQDQRIKCGWNRLDSMEQPRWLTTAVSSAVRDKWISAFQTVSGKASLGKTKLKAIYPYIGSCASQLADIYADDDTYILELHRAYISLLKYRNGHLLDCQLLETSSNMPKMSDIEELLRSADIPDDFEIYVLVTHPDRNELRESLNSIPYYQFKLIEKELRLPVNLPNIISSSEAVMLIGATSNYTGKNNQIFVSVQGQEPPPPLHKRPESKIAASVFAFVLLISLIEVAFYMKSKSVETMLSDLEEKVSKQELVLKDVGISKKTKKRIDELNKQHNNLTAVKKLVESILVSRQDFMAVFLDILTRNLNDNIMINSIEEEDWNGFVIEGWALDQPSIDYYSQGLSRELQLWNMIITENPSSIGINATGYSGYNFKFVIKEIRKKNITSIVDAKKTGTIR